jgi:hypothetical protein
MDQNEKNTHDCPSGKSTVDINKDHFITALRLVGEAISNWSGADCVLYAMVGAGTLNRLGMTTRPAAGSAAWRVGPGDGDMISHASEANGPKFAPVGAARAENFHAWIESEDGVESFLIDPTTWQLHNKARLLDSLDGGTTQVQFAPELLWVPLDKATKNSFSTVQMSYDVGVYFYLKKPEIEKLVFNDRSDKDTAYYVEAVLKCYTKLLIGEQIQVVGVGSGEDGSSSPSGITYRQTRP